MANTESFDDFNATEQMAQFSDIKPFQFRDDPEDEEKTLKWLNDNFRNKMERAHSRFITYRRYQAYWKGIHWRYFDARDSQRDIEYTTRKPRHVVNFVWDMTDQRVAQMSRMGIDVVLMPAHDDQDDINNAKACKMLLKARSEEINLNEKHDYADMVKFTFGHVFMGVFWDKSQGPINPRYKKLSERYGKKVPFVDKKGKPVKGKYIEDLKLGDVTVEVLGPDKVFPELGVTSWDKVNEVDMVEWRNKWEVKKEYPEHEEDIKESSQDFFYDFEFTELTKSENDVMVRTFYHKKTKWLPNGACIKYTNDVILEWKDYPYDEETLPFVSDTDIDIYGELWGRSFISNIEQMQRMYNNTQSSQARDYGIGSAPKWMMPKGSCKISSLNNEFTIVEYTGPRRPEMVTHKATSEQSFVFQDRIEGKISKFSRVYDISRGEPPKGVTANSALRFLDEQESQVIAPMQKKRKRRVVEVYKMMLRRMKQYYNPNDERMISLLGENNEYLIKSFKKADFSRVNDVKLQNSSSLPDTKTGKISTIVDLNATTQADPIFKKEEIVQMLDLGLEDSFTNGATVAVTAANTVVETLLDGGEVPEPRPTDNFLVYYSVFDKVVQSFTFRNTVSPDIVERFNVYITVLEGLMYQRAKKNIKFCQMLMDMDNYPMFFVPEEPLTVVLQHHMGPQTPSPGAEIQGADTTKVKNITKRGDENESKD